MSDKTKEIAEHIKAQIKAGKTLDQAVEGTRRVIKGGDH